MKGGVVLLAALSVVAVLCFLLLEGGREISKASPPQDSSYRERSVDGLPGSEGDVLLAQDGLEGRAVAGDAQTNEEDVSDWLPEFDSMVIVEKPKSFILQTYWGDLWPEVEATLRAGLGDLNVDTVLLGSGISEEALENPLYLELGYDKLQGRDEYLDNLKYWLLSDFDSPASPTFPFHSSIALLAGVSFAPLDGFRSDSVIAAGVRKFAPSVAPDLTAIELVKVRKRAESELETVVGELLEELAPTAATLNQAIRTQVALDLDGVDADSMPERGSLFVGPYMATPLDPSGLLSDASTARYVLVLYGGREVDGWDTNDRLRRQNQWAACYSLDLRTVPALSAALAHAESERDRITGAIRDLIVAEIEAAK